MGADFKLYANKDDVDRVAFVKDHTYGAGADIVLDMAGSPQALTEGFKMLRRGGRFSAFGIAAEVAHRSTTTTASCSRAPRSTASTAG